MATNTEKRKIQQDFSLIEQHLSAIEKRLSQYSDQKSAKVGIYVSKLIRDAIEVFQTNPKISAGILRMALEIIVNYMYEYHYPDEVYPDKRDSQKCYPKLVDMIRKLSSDKWFRKSGVSIAHFVRMEGNDALHPGGELDQDRTCIVYGLMFQMVPLLEDEFLKTYCKDYAEEATNTSSEPIELGPNPYRGLEKFGLQDAAMFFGREAETQELLALSPQSFITISGASGSGKSSLALAGLAAGLKKQGWEVLVCRPSKQPFYELAFKLASNLYSDSVERSEKITHIQAKLMGQQLDIASLLAQIRGDKPGVLLLIDQFEELFTHTTDSVIIAQYCAMLNQAARSNPGRILYAITIRADFIGQALQNPDLADILDRFPKKLLGPISNLRPVIEQPATNAGAKFEPLLVERIIQDLEYGNRSQAPSATAHLPLLQFTLEQLWDAQDNGTITHYAYAELDGVNKSLSHFAEQFYMQLSEADQSGMRRVLIQLVRPGLGTVDTRQLSYREQIATADWPMVNRLADQRLVVTNRDETHQLETIEIVHEALLHQWQRLRDWMDEDRPFRLWQEKLRQSQADWEASGKHESLLLAGIRLGEAEEYLSIDASRLAASEQEFISKSRAFADTLLELEQRREREIKAALTAQVQASKRLVKRTLMFVFVISLLGAGASWQWWQTERQREIVEEKNIVALDLLEAFLALPIQLENIPEAKNELYYVLYSQLDNLERVTEVLDSDNMDSLRRKLTNKNLLSNIYSRFATRNIAQKSYEEAVEIGRIILNNCDNACDAFVLKLIAETERNSNQLELARTHYLKALQLFKKQIDNTHDDSIKIEISDILLQLGKIEAIENPVQARKYYLESLDKLSNLHETESENTRSLLKLAVVHERLAELELNENNIDLARNYANSALTLFKKLNESDLYHNSLDLNYSQLGEIEYKANNIDQARKFFEQSLSLEGNKSRDLLSGLTIMEGFRNLGVLESKAGQTNHARDFFLKAKDIIESFYKLDLNNSELSYELAGSYIDIGDLEFKVNNDELALEYYQQAISLSNQHKQTVADNLLPADVLANLYGRVAFLKTGANQPAEAREYYAQSLELYKQLQEQQPDNQYWTNNIAEVLTGMGYLERVANQPAKAKEYYAQALTTRKQLQERQPDNLDWACKVGTALNEMGNLDRDANQHIEARENYNQALNIFKRLSEQHSNNLGLSESLATVLYNLGSLEMSTNQIDMARSYWQQEIAVRKNLYEQDPNNTSEMDMLAGTFFNLGLLETQAHQADNAREYFGESMSLNKRLLAEEPSNTVWTNNLAVVESHLNKLKSGSQPIDAIAADSHQSQSYAGRQSTSDARASLINTDKRSEHPQMLSVLRNKLR